MLKNGKHNYDRIRYDYTIHDLKLEQLNPLNEGIINLPGIDIMLIIILIILGLPLKELVIISVLHYKVREEQPKVFEQPTAK